MEPLKLRIGSTFSSLGGSSSNSNSPLTPNGSSFNNKAQSRLIQDNVIYRNQGKLAIGQINRFIIRYDLKKGYREILQDSEGKYIWLRVRNVETQFFRPIYFTGPFSFYIDVTPNNYTHKKSFEEPIEFNSDIKPGQSFKTKIRLNDNSLIDDDVYGWTVDVASQVALTTKFVISFDFMIGYDYKLLRKVSNGMQPNDNRGSFITVQKQTTSDLWNRPPKRPDDHVHLVVLTHGIFSNVGADMMFIKDEIERLSDTIEKSNIIVRGYEGNVGKSEKGIRYLGRRVAKFVLEVCDESQYKIDRISFVGHSLGGPVQACAIAHIVAMRPDFFKSIKPINFINLAAPFLGILSDFPMAVSLALDVGALGKTGRDLTLSHSFPSLVKKVKNRDPKEVEIDKRLTAKPILEVIPNGAAHTVFESFQNRTVYANAVNDGIVPLRTSALLYLDWRGLGDLKALKEKYEKLLEGGEDQKGERARKGSVGEIPQDENGDRRSIISAPDDESDEKNVSDPDLKGKTNKSLDGIKEENRKADNVSDPNLTKKAMDAQDTDSSNGKVKVKKSSVSKDDKNSSNSKISSSSILRASTSIFTENPKKSKRKKLKRYIRTQTRSSTKKKDNEQSEWVDVNENDGDQKEEIDEYNIPPAASTFLSAANVMKSPIPHESYLQNPKLRAPTIFHDKRYTYDDLPPPHFTKKLSHKKFKSFLKRDKNVIEEKIARDWHCKMEWRKVLVTLKPDAHNNIVVRRKFSNAFGWGVIDHLVENHFGEEAIDKEVEVMRAIRENETRSFNTNIDDFY